MTDRTERKEPVEVGGLVERAFYAGWDAALEWVDPNGAEWADAKAKPKACRAFLTKHDRTDGGSDEQG